uniref:Uncharacterized protein n=1 Tax=Sphaerodactylus townsendi TaxID=933632 RepID=A0ACB8GET7_9SAUR
MSNNEPPANGRIDQALNFQKYKSSDTTDLNTPYDYESIMHYSPFSFSKNKSLPTITTNILKFDGIIGQRQDFSSSDIKRLNQMYNCTRSLTLLDQCNFESADICGLVQERRDDADWVHKKSNSEDHDHSLRGKCEGGGYFMFFNTSVGKAGKTAILKSRILHPRRMQQCLQFFFKMTGSPKDKLVIWAQKDDGSGTVRTLVKLQTLRGKSGGSKTSSGGILIDDITLTETLCPNAVWHVDNISQLLDTAALNYTLKSPRFYSPEGYAYHLILSPRVLVDEESEKYMGIFFHLTSGEHDGALEWPAINRQATITVLDQDADVMKRMSIEKSFTTLETHVVKGT